MLLKRLVACDRGLLSLALPQFAHLPIVVVSTRDSPEDRLRGMQAGADAYLTKQSLNAGELIEQVRRLAGR